MCRILKFLQIWQNFWFLHICCLKNLKFLYTWRNFRFLHICHVLKSEISPHDQFFLHLYIGDRGDKYEVCSSIFPRIPFYSPLSLLFFQLLLYTQWNSKLHVHQDATSSMPWLWEFFFWTYLSEQSFEVSLSSILKLGVLWLIALLNLFCTWFFICRVGGGYFIHRGEKCLSSYFTQEGAFFLQNIHVKWLKRN